MNLRPLEPIQARYQTALHPDNEFIIHDAREKSKQFFHNFMRKRKIEEGGFKSDSENSETAFRRSLHRAAVRKADALRVKLHADHLAVFMDKALVDAVVADAQGDKSRAELTCG